MKIQKLALVALLACLVAVIALYLPDMDDRGYITNTAPVESEVTGNAMQNNGKEFDTTPVKQSLGLPEDRPIATNTVVDIEPDFTGNIETARLDTSTINGSNQLRQNGIDLDDSMANADTQMSPSRAAAGRMLAINGLANSAPLQNSKTHASAGAINNTASAAFSSGLSALNAPAGHDIGFSKAKTLQPDRLSLGSEVSSGIGAQPGSNGNLAAPDAASEPNKRVNSIKSGLGNLPETEPGDGFTEVTDGSMDDASRPVELADLAANGPETTSPDANRMAGDIESSDPLDPQEATAGNDEGFTEAAGLLAGNTEKAEDLIEQQEENGDETTTTPGTMLYPFDEGYSELVMAEYLTRQQYLDHTDETFWLYANQQDPPIELVLRRVVMGSGEAFTLRFRTRDMQSLPQKTFKVNHDTLGAMALFLTSSKNARGRRTVYNAIINKEPG